MKSNLDNEYTNNKQHSTIDLTHIDKITPQELRFLATHQEIEIFTWMSLHSMGMKIQFLLQSKNKIIKKPKSKSLELNPFVFKFFSQKLSQLRAQKLR